MIIDEVSLLSIAALCRVLEVSRTGFYRWRKSRHLIDAKQRDTVLIERIKSLHDRAHGSAGFRVIHAMLKLQGEDVPQRRVRRLMHENGLFGRPSGRRKRYKGSSRSPVAEDRIRRQFHADRPNCRWVSDITEFKTLEGKLYLCHVVDLYDGVIVGWSTGSRATSELVICAAAMALRERIAPKELIFHSDRGSQYTSKALQSWLEQHGLTGSMGAVGTSADNASAESVFSRLKFALRDVSSKSSREKAISYIDNYIVEFYNTMRRYKHAAQEKSSESILAALGEEEDDNGTPAESLGIESHEKPKIIEDEN